MVSVLTTLHHGTSNQLARSPQDDATSGAGLCLLCELHGDQGTPELLGRLRRRLRKGNHLNQNTDRLDKKNTCGRQIGIDIVSSANIYSGETRRARAWIFPRTTMRMYHELKSTLKAVNGRR